MPTIQVRDTTLYYERAGSGPELLFIHGMCGDAAGWAGQVDRLGDRFTCVTYDRRGHTRSAAGTEPESAVTHASDAVALIEALHLTRPVLVGSSSGGRIGLEVARTRPDLIAGAVLSEPAVTSLDPEAGRALMADIGSVVVPAAKAGGPRAAVDTFFPLMCPGLWAGLDETRRDRFRANGHIIEAELSAPPYVFTSDDARRIDVPALVIAGTTSHPAMRSIAATLARSLPHARLLELDDCGHVTYVEQPDRFAAAVRAFAGSVAVRARSTGENRLTATVAG